MSKRARENEVFIYITFPEDVWLELLTYTGPLFLLNPLCKGWPSPRLTNLLVKSMNELCQRVSGPILIDRRPALLGKAIFKDVSREATEWTWRSLMKKKCTVPMYRNFTSLLPLQEKQKEAWKLLTQPEKGNWLLSHLPVIDVFILTRRPKEETDLLERFFPVYGDQCEHREQRGLRIDSDTRVGQIKFQHIALEVLISRENMANFPRRPVVAGPGKRKLWALGNPCDHIFFVTRPTNNVEKVCLLLNTLYLVKTRLTEVSRELANEFSQLSLL